MQTAINKASYDLRAKPIQVILKKQRKFLK